METRQLRQVAPDGLTIIEAADYAREHQLRSVDWEGLRVYMSGPLEDLQFSHIRVINSDAADGGGGISDP